MTRTAYDETPYVSGPQYSTHPDHLATNARLMGLDSAHPESCRVLELGCGDGGNLIPMALALPESHFWGVDLSAIQVEMGHSLISRLRLENIELRAMDLMDFPPDAGKFDYILCHGVFSWVPLPVQERILAICRTHLSPRGVAHISYNAYPGWHLRAIVRDMVLFETRDLTSPGARVEQARAYLRFLRDAIPSKSPLSPLVAAACTTFDESPDWYLLHEYLEENNHPLYFHEFMRMAEQHDLQYLCEGWFHTRLDEFPAETQATIRNISENWQQIEQHVDFLSTRTFRRTLVCHKNLQLSRSADLAFIGNLSATALAQPQDARRQWADDSKMTFTQSEGRSLTTNNPILKAALGILWDQYPAAITVNDLYDEVARRVEVGGSTRDDFAGFLVQFYLGNLVTLHSAPPRFGRWEDGAIVASPLARIQAEQRSVVVNLRHQLIDLSPLGRLVLRLMDGRTEPEIVESATEIIRSEAMDLSGETLDPPGETGARPTPPLDGIERDDPPSVPRLVQQTVRRLARKALLLPTTPQRSGGSTMRI